MARFEANIQRVALRIVLSWAPLLFAQGLLLWASGPVSAQQSYETYYRYIKDYPSNRATGWTEHPQGATHDRDNWYITQEKALWRIPVEHDLNSVSNGDPGVVKIELDDLPVLTKARFNHFGDPTHYEYGGKGFVLVPLEGEGGQGIAVFRADATLNYLTYSPIKQDHAAWCAVDPSDPEGHLYSAPSYDSASDIYKYRVDWETLRYGKPPELVLTYESSLTLSPKVVAGLQGGKISPDGKLLYLSMFGGTDDKVFSGIRVYDIPTGKLVRESANGSGWFNYEIHPKSFQVAEGLVIWDLDDGRAPGIRGQLHVFMFYHPDIKIVKLARDGVYFKHYDGAMDVDGIAGIDKQPKNLAEVISGKPTTHPSLFVPFKTVGFAHSNAWNGARINIQAGSYPETLTLSKPVKLVAKGGTVTIGR